MRITHDGKSWWKKYGVKKEGSAYSKASFYLIDDEWVHDTTDNEVILISVPLRVCPDGSAYGTIVRRTP